MYTYDDAGNILTKSEYAYTTGTLGTPTDTVSYAYTNASWGDLLTSYDGVATGFDGVGNHTRLDGWTYTWEHGRQLKTAKSGSTTWTNTYNPEGMRIRRTNGTTTYQYVYNGSSLSQMTVDGNTLRFTYDASGNPVAVTYNGTTYYYATNLQGDVVAILNSAGSAVVTYTYDAWGKVLTTSGSLASTLGTHNPLRYRGYVYDQETSLYYLQSRYYNPKLCRFINADALVATGQGLLGNNMFAYCGNDPVNRIDASGRSWLYEFGDPDSIPGYLGKLIGELLGEWLYNKTEEDKATIATGEVKYVIKGNGEVRIENSNRINTPWMMYSFVKDHRGNEIKGSTTGVVYEWVVHNVAYDITKSKRAEALDVGTTIYADRHGIFSVIMATAFAIAFPLSAVYDLGREYGDYGFLYPRG